MSQEFFWLRGDL